MDPFGGGPMRGDAFRPLAVQARGLRCTYPGQASPALVVEDLVIARGELVVVMGHTGAGKSTLLKCLTGIVPTFEAAHVEGSRCLLGQPVEGLRPGDLAGRVAMVFQDFEAQLFSTNVALEVGFALDQVGIEPEEIRARTRLALERVGLGGFDARDPASLSGGEKQRLAMAAVLALEPELVLLDEPTTDVDPLGKRAIFDLLADLRRGGTTVVVVEHETAAAEVADRVLLLEHGRVAELGASREVLRNTSALVRCGVRPRDLDRLAAHLTLPESLATVSAAEALVRERLPAIPIETAVPESLALGEARLLELDNVVHEYGGTTRALDGVSLAIGKGEFVALIGQNGSGKTTLAKHLNGLLRPTSGAMALGGVGAAGLTLGQIARRVGFVFQNPDHQLFCESVRDEVAYGPRHLGLPVDEVDRRVGRALEIAGLTDRASADPFLLGKGERQRLAVVSVLALEPEVLILDEPTTGLDDREQRAMLEFLRERNRSGTTIIVITHAPRLVAEYAQRAVLLSRGRVLFDGPTSQLFQQRELLEAASFAVPDGIALATRLGIPALGIDDLLRQLELHGLRRESRP